MVFPNLLVSVTSRLFGYHTKLLRGGFHFRCWLAPFLERATVFNRAAPMMASDNGIYLGPFMCQLWSPYQTVPLLVFLKLVFARNRWLSEDS